MAIEFLEDGRKDADRTLILAHGAGAAMDSDFMNVMAKGLAGEGIHVVRFEFPYMARRRRDGTKSPPDRAPVLLDCWRAVVREFDPAKTLIGGKSLGGRMASMIAATASPSVPAPIKAPRQPHRVCMIRRLAGATADPSMPAPLLKTSMRTTWVSVPPEITRKPCCARLSASTFAFLTIWAA